MKTSVSKITVTVPAQLVHDVFDGLRILPAAKEAMLGHLDSRGRGSWGDHTLELAAIENAHGLVPIERLLWLVVMVAEVNSRPLHGVPFMSTETIHQVGPSCKRLQSARAPDL